MSERGSAITALVMTTVGVSTVAPRQFFCLGRHDFLTFTSKSPWMLANLLVGLSTKIRQSIEKVSG